eukprot:4981910-Prorocentrum_lima.AAC.1
MGGPGSDWRLRLGGSCCVELEGVRPRSRQNNSNPASVAGYSRSRCGDLVTGLALGWYGSVSPEEDLDGA